MSDESKPIKADEITKTDWAHLVPPIFAACVSTTSRRYALSAPFLRDGRLYATDGMIAVWMPWDGPWEHTAMGRIPDVSILFQGIREASIPLPSVDNEACEGCGGSRAVVERKCPNCAGGSRNVVSFCDCPHCTGAHSCSTCDGAGTLAARRCLECDGTGVDDHRVPVLIAPDYWLARGYAALLRRFGVYRVHLPAKGSGLACGFRLGDIEGRLMPINSSKDGDKLEDR
jgi:hypothetical protein